MSCVMCVDSHFLCIFVFFFFSSRRRHTRWTGDWSSDVCSSDLSKLIGGRVVQSSSIDVGVAVEAEDGIMVPIIRSADKTSLVDLTAKYKELVNLARQRRISPDMQAGGIAAVSNFGTFGVEWGTPIPLPDQTLLLGLGMGKKVPSWDESKQQFVPKTEAQITLSFDHRSIDGGGAGRLLKRVIELLEDPKDL